MKRSVEASASPQVAASSPPRPGRPWPNSESVAPSRRELLGVGATTIAFIAVLVSWALFTPLYQAADELQHVDAVLHLALGYGWADPGTMHLLSAAVQTSQDPASTAGLTWGQLLAQYPGLRDSAGINQMSQHPPTYYFLGAGLLHLIGFEHLQWNHAVLALRLLDVLLVAPLPLLAWATVRRVTGSPRAALVGGMAILAVPQIAIIGSAVTNDAPVFLLSAATTFLAARILTGDRRLLSAVLLGGLLGALMLMKGTGLPVIPFVGIAVIVGTLRSSGVRTAIARTAVTAVITALIGAWWWVRNVVVFGAVQPEGFVGREPQPFPPGRGPDLPTYVTNLWTRLTETFWGSAGRTAHFPVTQVLIDVGTVLTIGVIVLFAFRRSGFRVEAVVLATLPVTFALVETTKAWADYEKMGVVGGTQGRYYFPALVAVITLSALAWRRLPRTSAGRSALAIGLTVTFGLISFYGVTFAYRTFWEGGAFAVSRAGFAAFATGGNGPLGVVVVAVLVAAAAAAAAVVLTRQVMRQPR